MKKLIAPLLMISMITGLFSARAQQHTFAIKDGAFLYDGKPVQIHSGAIHFARVPRPYWRHRLQMLKAMGMNTVATYVFWNYEEKAPGDWDFKSDSRDIAAFIKLAQEVGLMVILRPGPYACAEWEFGGFPWWLQKNKSLVIRTDNGPFLDSCRVYFEKLAGQVRDLQVTHGGPIIMVQIENEFGSYVAQRPDIPFGDHRKYIEAIGKIVHEVGFDVPLFTSDGSWLFKGGSMPGALPTANGEDDIDKLKKVVNEYHHGEGPYMVAEFYPGWLDHWAEPFPKVDAGKIAAQTEKYLKNGISFNFYMAHGGTNFGFTSGTNYNKKHDIQPDMTSYDYDAPISEAGWATPKYTAIRNLMKQYAHYDIPPVPARIPVITLPDIHLSRSADLLKLKATMQPVVNDTPMTFEDLDQGYGYVLYSKKIDQPVKGTLDIPGLRDYAIVYVNGQKTGILNRYYNDYSCQVDIPAGSTLDILVENMGRINYGAEIVHNLKGIISPVKINNLDITGRWRMYRLPFTEQPTVAGTGKAVEGRPAIYEGAFTLKKTGDTFLDLRKWGKGIVFVNGHNLGRYWSAGPQQTLYLPGCWLKKGKNTIVVFEQKNDTLHAEISSLATPILDQLNPSKRD